jgi:hypothetical protein
MIISTVNVEDWEKECERVAKILAIPIKNRL